MRPKVIIIYGPPGSGKGTQAEKLAERFGLVHINTGYILEKKVHDPELQDDPIIKRERKLFDNGILCTSEWVAEIIKEEIKKVNEKGKGVVFSGSPRTLPEAKDLLGFLKDLYGGENIVVLKIEVKPETSIFRNSHRRVCKQCGFSIVYTPQNEKLNDCPKCGGKLVRRILDDPETIKIRLKDYKERTEPVCKLIDEYGIHIIDIDGEPSIKEVYNNILEKIERLK